MDLRDILFYNIYNLFKKDETVILLTADADAFYLRKIKEDFPSRFINTGVSEQNTVLVATGLAMAGYKPFVYSLTPFLSARAYEQIKISATMKLGIIFIGLGSGFSFSFDGPTHHAVTDIGLLKTIHPLMIFNPNDENTITKSLEFCYEVFIDYKVPAFIRLDKGEYTNKISESEVIGIRELKKRKDINIISTGTLVHEIYDELKNNDNVGLFDFYLFRQQNISVENLYLLEILQQSKKIIVIEENCENSGISSIISEIITKYNLHNNIEFEKFTLMNKQLFEYADRKYLLDGCGLNINKIIKDL